jgi:hypothetical protein
MFVCWTLLINLVIVSAAISNTSASVADAISGEDAADLLQIEDLIAQNKKMMAELFWFLAASLKTGQL